MAARRACAAGGDAGDRISQQYLAGAKAPAPIIAVLNKHLNEVIHTELFRKRMEALGMTVPADNTPEKFAEFMRRETARQAAFAKLSGHAPLGSQR